MMGFRLFIYVVIYIVLTELSRRVSYPNTFSPLWLPAGFALAVFATTQRRQWPLWTVGSIIASLVYNSWLHEKPAGVVFGFTLANLSRTLIGAWLIQSWLPGRFRLSSVRDVLVFAVAGCLLAPLTTMFFGAATLFFAYGTPWSKSAPAWLAGNVVGIMLLAPLSLVFIRRCQRPSRICDCGGPRDARTAVYFVVLTLTLLVAALIVFRFSTAPISFLVAPFMIWLTIQFELFGAVTSCFLVAMVLLGCTSAGYGPIAAGRAPEMQMLLSQGFLFSVNLTSLILASVVLGRRRAMSRIESTQKQLKELQRETQLILDTIPSMVFYQDRSDRVLRVNRSAAQWLDLPRQQIEGKEISEISGTFGSLKPAIAPLAMQPDEPLLGVEQTVTLPSGHTRWVQVDRVVLDGSEHQPRSMVVVLTDISDRKSAEADLQRSNQDLERYAIVASHDLKEPLRAVSGYCRFLQEDYSESLDSEGRRFVEKAIEGADRMQQMVNDLLEYSRVSRAELPIETVDLNAVVAGVRVDLQQRIVDTGANITVEHLPSIRGSHGQLTQLFQNLLSNSMKFVPKDRKPCITITSDCSVEDLSVIVADNGLGIAETNRTRVFEIFQRLNRREDYPGTGLGLAICERIMDRHHGGIEIISELGQGSQFRLRFPRHLEIA